MDGSGARALPWGSNKTQGVHQPSQDTPNRDAVRLWTALGPGLCRAATTRHQVCTNPARIPPTVTPCGYGRLWGPGSAVWQKTDTRCRPNWVVRNHTTASCDGQREQGGRVDWRLAAAVLPEPDVGGRQRLHPQMRPCPAHTSCPPPTPCGLVPTKPYASSPQFLFHHPATNCCLSLCLTLLLVL